MDYRTRIELGNRMIKHKIITTPELYIKWLNEEIEQKEEQLLLAKLFVAEEFPNLN